MTECPIPDAQGQCQPEGRGTNGVLMLAEALGKDELADGGLPLRPHAQAGSVIERAIRRAGFERDQFVLYNAIPTHPPNDVIPADCEAAAIAWGAYYVSGIVEQYQPSVILALGNVALDSCAGIRNVMLNRGYPGPSRYGIPVIGALHPSFLRRGAIAYFGVLMHDIRFAVALAQAMRCARLESPTNAAWREGNVAGSPFSKGGTLSVEFDSPVLWRHVAYTLPWPLPPLNEPLVPPGYVCYPTEADALAFLREVASDASRLLAYDIETPWSHSVTEDESDESDRAGDIVSIQFSLAPASGIYMPWRYPFIDVARAILALPNPKLSANGWRFDDPRLRDQGCPVAGDRHDLRWGFKHFQPDLSGALQFIASLYCPEIMPWKMLAQSHKEVYGIRDCDVLMRIA